MKNSLAALKIISAVALSITYIFNSAWAQTEEERIVVFGSTPVAPNAISAESFPGQVQSATSEDLERGGGLDITEHINRYFSGVNINSAQGNTLQPDVYYRGFAASPLLGLPAGLVIYQNGVRINEPLGDTVNWELLPMDAVAGINLIGGTNALYGLNSLGGAIVLEMKDGFNNPGTTVELNGGSYERVTGIFETGGSQDNFGYYINAQRFYERGWRDLSNSWTETIYSSLDWKMENGNLGLNYHRGLSSLTGNGALPAELVETDRETYFTAPDITGNDMVMWTLKGDYWISDKMHLSGNLFQRDNDTNSFNGDAGECEDAAGNEVDCDEPAAVLENECGPMENELCNAINNISVRDQKSRGGALQVEFPLDAFATQHNFTFGSGFSEGRTRFNSAVQETRFDRRRVTMRSGEFDDDEEQDLKTRITTAYAYANDTMPISDDWTLSLSGYYHDSEVRIRNRSDAPGSDALNGTHDFQNFNWSIGAIHQWSDTLDVYGSYSESSRLPTPIELVCSEEVLEAVEDLGGEEECRLPNAFLADPPLDEVTAENIEFGLRGYLANDWRWSVGAFHTVNKDDIIWQTTGRAQGLFRNVDETKRIGLEGAIAGSFYEHLDWAVNYTYLEATFEDDFEVFSPEHPNAVDDKIQVESGDTIPGLPEHLLKASLDYAFTDRLSAGLDMLANSGQYLRGDESNQLDKIGGYAIFTLRGSYDISDAVEVSLRVENLFDKDYENFGLLGEQPGEVAESAPYLTELAGLEDPRFYGVGAPIGAWLNIKIRI